MRFKSAFAPAAALLCLAAALAGAGPKGRLPRGPEIQLAPGTTVRNVREAYEYFSNSWTVVGLKDYPEATRVSPGGEFLLGDKTVCRILVGESLAPLDNRVLKTLDKGYLPIVGYDFVLNDGVEYDIEAFACPLPQAGPEAYDGSRDGNFVTVVRVALRNRTGSPQAAVVGLGWKAPQPVTLRPLPAGGAWTLLAGDALAGTLAPAPAFRVSEAEGRIELRADLAAGAAETVVFSLPFHALAKSWDLAALDLARLDCAEWRQRTVDFWEGLLGRAAKLSVPEDKVLQSYLASLVYQFIGRDNGELHAGEGFYDEMYLRDGSYQAISLAQAGFLDEARQSLEFFPRYQKENGQFLSQTGQLDANGYAVWALVEYGLISGDTAWLEKQYPRIGRAVDFLRAARRTETDPASPFFGVLPKAPADGENLWDGNNHIVGYDWWNLRAVQSAAEAAAALKKPGDAAAYDREFEAYRTDILRAVDRTGLPYLPPSYEKDGTHWGNLEAIFPTPLIDPLDRRLTATLDTVRDSFGRGDGARPGFIEGIIQWTPKTQAIHPYLSLFVTNSHLVRGEQDKAVDGLYAFLLHSTSTQGFPEGIYYRKREAWSDTVPHLWAAALYVTTLRDMLVREEGRDLHLLSAVPPAWLEPGKTVAFEDAPTRFGRMSLTVEARKDVLVISFSRPERTDPDRLFIHVPPDFEITEIVRCGNGVKISHVRDVYLTGPSLHDENLVRVGIRRRPGAPARDFSVRAAEFLAAPR